MPTWTRGALKMSRYGWTLLLLLTTVACGGGYGDDRADYGADEAVLADYEADAATLAEVEDAADVEVDLDELDEFAREYLADVQEVSIEAGVEYCGWFGYDSDGELAATEAVPGDADSCDMGEEPDDWIVIASYHTHGSYSPDADSEVPSIDDLEGDIDGQTYGYISTPGGRLWFNDWEAELATEIDPGPIQPDPNFQPCPAFAPDTEYTLPDLEERAENDTGEC
jgi:nucleotide-binding universal stress UspA family protein